MWKAEKNGIVSRMEQGHTVCVNGKVLNIWSTKPIPIFTWVHPPFPILLYVYTQALQFGFTNRMKLIWLVLAVMMPTAFLIPPSLCIMNSSRGVIYVQVMSRLMQHARLLMM